MKKWIPILVLASLCAMACAPKNQSDPAPPVDTSSADDSNTEELIIGGHLATKKSEITSTTVSLLDTRQGTLCTASLLSDSIAVTAAHCIDGNPADMELSFGPRSSGNEARPIVDVIASPTWGPHQHEESNNGDIALVHFSGGLPPNTKAAILMKSSHHLVDGEIVTLAGFGTANSDGSGAGKLRSVDVKISKANYSRTEVSLDQTQGKGACHGDSGGPAFVQNKDGELALWGVTSRGISDPTDHCAGESVYTRIQPYSRWINSVVRSWQKK